MSDRSELALLVETESRLDQAVAAAKQAGDEMHEAAERRAADAIRALDAALARERARIAEAIRAETAGSVRAIEDEARRMVARYETAQVEALARVLARRVLEEVA